MAVVDNYVEAQILAGFPNRGAALETKGSGAIELLLKFDTAAADSANSIYRVAKAIPATAQITEFSIWTDGVTGMSDVNVGVYEVGAAEPVITGAESIFADALNLSSAVTRAAGFDNGWGNLTNSDYGKMLWEIAGETLASHKQSYDIALKAIAAPSEADTIVVFLRYVVR